MPARDQSCLPPAPVTFYPRRWFPPLSRRPAATVNDRLVAHILAKLAPATRPRQRRRPTPGATSRVGAQRPSLPAASRRWNDLLGIWRQCEEPDCRRCRRCAGDPLSCLPRYLPLLPRSVRLWFACIGVAAEKNVSFTDALTLAEREGDEAACTRWHTAVRHALAAAEGTRRGMKDL